MRWLRMAWYWQVTCWMLCETWQEGLPSVCFEEVVQNSVGKPAYDVAKVYHPIGLLDTLCKLFSTLVAADLLDIMEKHQLFPPMQFSSRPGCNTTDSIHPVTQRIRDSWWKKQTALILFWISKQHSLIWSKNIYSTIQVWWLHLRPNGTQQQNNPRLPPLHAYLHLLQCRPDQHC